MNKRPKIVLTNDDGISAPGIKHLWNALKDHADLTIVAPAVEQSATGVSITLRQPLRVYEFDWQGATAWSVSGTPADCVKIALSVLVKEKPDLVLSGINRGTNAGRNVFYSGTIGGTIEAVLRGIPGIAFSCYDNQPNYAKTELFIPSIVQHVIEHPLPDGTLLNVNFPSDQFEQVKGIKLTRHGKEFWAENPDERVHPAEGHRYYWLGAKIARFEEHEDCDITWLNQGYITAVPIYVGELTHLQHIEAKKQYFENLFPFPQS